MVASRVTDTELWWLTCSRLLLSRCAPLGVTCFDWVTALCVLVSCCNIGVKHNQHFIPAPTLASTPAIRYSPDDSTYNCNMGSCDCS